GTKKKPLRSINAAAVLAHPGDVVMVHKGIYRERVDPQMGGVSDKKRIIYEAAPEEDVEISGAEQVKNWQKVSGDTWKVTLPNSFFGSFNPYNDLIHGDWFNGKGRQHHTGAVYLNGDWLDEAANFEDVLQATPTVSLWYAKVDDNTTTIWAQFKDTDPNIQNVEINVRKTVFYPSKEGINYITVRGFKLTKAATPWAPPTAEQMGLIGTHWSKGWIIENNTVSYSRCSGISLGKYGDEWDNKAQSAEGYVGTINRAEEHGWNGDNIGHNIVRNNVIAHCEQAGIVGSLGCIFSVVTGNEIHDIHVRRLFTGAEMAAIKFHGSIDVIIAHNHIYRSILGIWLDWMAQGTRVSANLMHDNNQDIFVEVDHGPFMIDNNIMLSAFTMYDHSEGGAFVHNLALGKLPGPNSDQRKTPYFKPHSTTLAGFKDIPGGDIRFYNNVLNPKANLNGYKNAKQLCPMAGNITADSLKAHIYNENGIWYLELSGTGNAVGEQQQLVTSALLGKVLGIGLPFENPDGSNRDITVDYFGNKRPPAFNLPGPFSLKGKDGVKMKVWPVKY
ncbi:MAG TPA: hypothetical protein VL442_22020, partial [Mucilaginibacter sp.]|nr:hypothetical protein [Mucilaginibacter sp.]